jgi:hypothetical protein
MGAPGLDSETWETNKSKSTSYQTTHLSASVRVIADPG